MKKPFHGGHQRFLRRHVMSFLIITSAGLGAAGANYWLITTTNSAIDATQKASAAASKSADVKIDALKVQRAA
ncbi:MAG: hypothetical protein EOT05_03585 [Candidatus Microsaccharimonas sossegonensis]|uniref:Uncharacterized protein n=1 Tax=Candidatus Microsaccharimonas sossegonensis TaxID=2506948 RepID=A0A4Q0AHZ0_9BACT|nr:MAG: hypothetical protein EOT05_03585 [Candidatus Microsaccharimonas sossegonensis]